MYDGTPEYTSERIQRTEHGEAWTCAGDVERVTAVARCEPRQGTYTRTVRAEGAGWALAIARCDVGDELLSAACEPERVRLSTPAADVEGFGAGWSCGGERDVRATVTCGTPRE